MDLFSRIVKFVVTVAKAVVEFFTGDPGHYDDSVSVEEAVDVQANFNEMHANANAKLTEILQGVEATVSDVLIQAVETLKDSSDLFSRHNIDLTHFSAECREFTAPISNEFKRHFWRRISLDDKQCRDILEIREKEHREQEFAKFVNRVTDEAYSNLVKAVKRQSDSLYMHLHSKVSTAISDNRAAFYRTKSSLEKIIEDEASAEQEHIRAQLNCEMCGYIFGQLS